MNPSAALDAAIGAAASIGLDTTTAERTARLIDDRLGFEGGTYVFALAGGTGVGKSSLLNALAGSQVAEVRAIRPTTSEPLAWVAAEDRSEVTPLLDWVGVADVVTHHREDLADVAVLDLPDVDSVKVEHRATVDVLLPRIDAVYWVVDSEKYDDERLHQYFRSLARHGDRMVFLFNKAERLASDEQQLLVSDLERRLTLDGIRRPVVKMVSARNGQGVEELRANLAGAAQAKQALKEKLDADARQALVELADAAGADGRPLVGTDEIERAIGSAVAGALVVVDPKGLGRQVERAMLNLAQRRGGSLLARLLSALTALTGTRRRQADPEGFLLNWRQRGSLGHLLNPLRALVVSALSALPPPARPQAMIALGFDDLEDRLVVAIDRTVRTSRSQVVPKPSWMWNPVGVLQLILGAGFVFGLAWYLLLIFGPGDLGGAQIDVPYLGPVPAALVIVAGTMVASFVLGLLLSLHARFRGRRLGRQIAAQVADSVRKTVTENGLEPLRRVEEAREAIHAALLSINS